MKTERIYGSPRFIGLTRKVGETPPVKWVFQPTKKNPGDLVL